MILVACSTTSPADRQKSNAGDTARDTEGTAPSDEQSDQPPSDMGGPVAPIDEAANGGGANSDAGAVWTPPYVLRSAHVYAVADTEIFVDEQGNLQLIEAGSTPEVPPDYLLEEHELADHTIMAAFIDSHVHLEYYDVAARLPDSGVFAAIDLAAPIESLEKDPPAQLRLVRSGPMLTAPLGYPTQGWGRNGFGLEVATVDEARAGATALLDAGAQILKVPLAGAPYLTDEQVEAIVEIAHARQVLVATHALTDETAMRARTLGCDLLAHTPTAALSAETITAWADGGVVSTLAAFGGGRASEENLKQLANAGTTVLYGTDLGNLRTNGLALAELQRMQSAGLSNEAIIASFSTVPSELFDLDVGRLQAGLPAHFVVVAGSPLENLEAVVEPRHVVFDGRRIAP